ncbi:MAG: hypothetical protein ACE5FH_06810 [Candidatus Zixiibacteriota bacterium]
MRELPLETTDTRFHGAPVVVLGTGITALGVIRSLGRAGITAYCLSADLKFVAHSRYCRALSAVAPLRSLNQLEVALNKLPFNRAILIPCTDNWACQIALLDRQLAERYPSCLPSSKTLECFTDKSSFYELLDKLSLPHPATHTISSHDGLAVLDDSCFECAFLKPRDSQRFFEHFWLKAFRVGSKSEALESFDKIAAAGFEVVLQEYIPGPPTNHYFIDGFIDRHGNHCATFARQRLRMYPEDFGNSTYMVSIPADQIGPAVENIKALLAAVSYRGIYSVEFKRDERDGVYRMLEVNCRPWWFIGFAASCGVNVCRMAYFDACHRPVAPVTRYLTGKYCVYPYYDANICYKLFRQGQLSLLEWIRSWAGTEQPVMCLDDPWPSIAWFAAACMNKIRTSFGGDRL